MPPAGERVAGDRLYHVTSVRNLRTASLLYQGFAARFGHGGPPGLRAGFDDRAEPGPAGRRADARGMLEGVDRPRVGGAGPVAAAGCGAGAVAAGGHAGGVAAGPVFGALAQFEQEIIRDRTVAGLTAARARGRVGGRPSKLSAEQVRQARRMYDARELTVEQIGAVLGVSRTSIYRALGKTTMPAPSASAAHAPGRPAEPVANEPGDGGEGDGGRRCGGGDGGGRTGRRGAAGGVLAGPVALVRGGGRSGQSGARADGGGQRSYQPEGGHGRVGPGPRPGQQPDVVGRGGGGGAAGPPPTRSAPG